MNITVSEKYVLSLEEASVYFNIGINHLRQMIKENPNTDWVLWKGTHALIKRKSFENYIDRANAV